MKKLINKPEDFARETIEGIVLAHPESLKMVNNSWHCLVRADEKKEGKVAIATGGGSGHLPVFLGYVGYGLADGVTVGNVFASPSAEAMLCMKLIKLLILVLVYYIYMVAMVAIL